MAGGRKEYELLFKLKAALGSNYTGTFTTAMNTQKQLQNTLTKINSISGKIDSYTKQSGAIENNRQKLVALNAEHEKLQREIKQTEAPSESLRKKFEKNTRQIEEATLRMGEQKRRLSELGAELRTAGINTNNLEKENKELARSYEALKRSQTDWAKLAAEYQKVSEAISNTKTKLTGTITVAAAVGTAIYLGPIKSAKEFQSAMADVVKVVDGLKDKSTGQLTQEYQNMKKSLLDMSLRVPIVAKDLTKISAAAGQAGIARQEIVEFTEDAAKMGVAFDTTAEQSGDWMAKWRTSFNMSQKDVVALADRINLLSDSTASSAQEIANIVTKVGPLGEVAGLSSAKIAAMGAALVSVGIQDDVAATGIKKLAVEMTAGASVTDRQATVLKKMGISAKELAKRMQTDAQGAILDFLKAINKLPKAEQTAALSDYFGTESVGAIAPLLTRLDLLKTSFSQVGDSALYAGSMEREFASRSSTVENKSILAKNSVNKLSIAVGEAFLPAVGEAAEKLSDLVNRLAEYTQKNPELVKTIAKVTTGLIALKAGSLVAKLGFLEMKNGVLSVQKIIKLFTSNVAVAGVETVTSMTNMSKSVSLLKTAFTALTGPVGIAVAAIGAIITAVVLFKNAQEEARQRTLNFTDDLKAAADGFQKVNDNVNQTKALVEEYRNLEDKVKKVATSSDEAAKAKERMKEIEDLLIQQNPEIISKYDQENGKISENLSLIENKLQKEREIAKIQYEQKQYEAEQKLPDALQEIKGINEKTKSLREQYDVNKKIRDGLYEITQEWELINATTDGITIPAEKFQELTTKASELMKTVGVNSDFSSMGIAGINTTYSEYVGKVSGLVENITKNQEELNTVTQSVRSYYDASVKLTELDLGGNFQSVSNSLVSMNTELENLEKKGQGGSQRAIELKDKIAELEPRLATAAAEIRDLAIAIESVPEVKTVNVSEATKNIDGFIAKLNQIPTSKKTQLIIEQNNKKLPGYATGGIITKPTVATFAEKVPEAAIPIDGSANSKMLWLKTGKLLGMNTAPAIVNATAQKSNFKRETIQKLQQAYSVNTAAGVEAPTVKAGSSCTTTIQISNQPIIHIDSNKPDDLDEKLKKNNEDLLNKVDEKMRKKEEDERRGRYD